MNHVYFSINFKTSKFRIKIVIQTTLIVHGFNLQFMYEKIQNYKLHTIAISLKKSSMNSNLFAYNTFAFHADLYSISAIYLAIH